VKRIGTITAIIATGLAAPGLSYPAETFRLEGAAYRPNVPVALSQSMSNLPVSIMVYKVLPQQFSSYIFSNVLAIAGFTTKTMKLSPDKKTMSWQHIENGGPVRTLEMAPAYGYIHYEDYQAVKGWGGTLQGVPARADIDTLAMDYLKRLGGDTNQVCLRQRSATERRQSRFDKKLGKYGEPAVTMRGAMYARQLDGIRFLGAGGRGGFEIDFGNDAKVSSLHFDWRRLQAYKRYQTLTPDKILSQVLASKAVISDENGEIPSSPTKLTITKITPYYMSQLSGTPEELIYPFASLDVVAQIGGTNTATFYLDCPILSTNEIKLP
jgi:hypothetical protein